MEKMWLANGLTLARIPLAALFWATYGNLPWSIAIVAAAALSDAFDGRVARWARAHATRPTSTAGEWLDPLADKLFVGAALAAAIVHGDLAWQLALVVIARELVLAPLALIYRIARPHVAHAYQADALGKATTIAQIFALVAIVAHFPIAAPLALLAGALGLVAAAHYIVRAGARRQAAGG
jgi:cardiolipin synthase